MTTLTIEIKSHKNSKLLKKMAEILGGRVVSENNESVLKTPNSETIQAISDARTNMTVKYKSGIDLISKLNS
jgi:hypothetical protein